MESGSDPTVRPQRAPTLLLVDDEPTIRRLVSRALRADGFVVHEADSGESALAALAELGTVDLLITDLIMPGMDGAELARRALALCPTLPVLFVSGYCADLLEDDLWTNPVELLQKPFPIPELVRRARRLHAG